MPEVDFEFVDVIQPLAGYAGRFIDAELREPAVLDAGLPLDFAVRDLGGPQLFSNFVYMNHTSIMQNPAPDASDLCNDLQDSEVTLDGMSVRKTDSNPQTRPRRRNAQEALADNLKILMGEKWTSKTLAVEGIVSKRCIDDMRDGKYNPFRYIEAVARRLNTDAWVLLCPTEVIEIADVFKVYLETTDEGRAFIRVGLDAARKVAKGEDI